MFAFEHGRETRIIEVFSPAFRMVFPPGVAIFAVGHVVPIPLRVLLWRAPARYGVETPMNEDAELGIEVPLGTRPLIKRVPLRFIRKGFGGNYAGGAQG